MYTGFAGRYPPVGDEAWQDSGLWSFKPGKDGTGTWTNLNDTADAYFTTGSRPFLGSVASGNGTGWFLGGNKDYSGNETYVPTSGLLSYDFAANKASNASVAGVSMAGWASYAQMHYVPNFGPAGVLISVGGLHDDPADEYLTSMSTVQILDPSTGDWYEQATTGTAPAARKEFCLAGAASTNETYELVVYAGWNGTLGDNAIPWDDLHVLSLPSFHWFQASYDALHPRHGLTCEHLGGGQILAVGGVDSTQLYSENWYLGPYNTEDTHPQGLAVFDLGSMSWTNAFESNRSSYSQSTAVRAYYEENDRMADFTNSALERVFSVQNFTAAATGVSGGQGGSAASTTASAGDAGSGGSSSSSSSSSSAGPIAGGVVGGVALAGILGAAVFYFLRRRQRLNGPAPPPAGSGAGAYMDDASKAPRYEMYGQQMQYNRSEMSADRVNLTEPRFEMVGHNVEPIYHREEMSGSGLRAEADPHAHRVEMP